MTTQKMIKLCFNVLLLCAISVGYSAVYLDTLSTQGAVQTNAINSKSTKKWSFQTNEQPAVIKRVIIQLNDRYNKAIAYPARAAPSISVKITSSDKSTNSNDVFEYDSYNFDSTQVILKGNADLKMNSVYQLELGCSNCNTVGFDQTSINSNDWKFTTNLNGSGFLKVLLEGESKKI